MRNLIRCYFPTAVFFLSIQLLSAQSYYLKHYSAENGLTGSTVYCVTQDSKGFIWFGTESGVSRFDGRTFTRFTTDDGLADNEVFQIHEDSRGRLWFLTFNGKLSFYYKGNFFNSGNDKVLSTAQPISNMLISFHEDVNGNVWIGSYNDGLIKIADSVITFQGRQSDQSGNVQKIEPERFVLEDKAGNLTGIGLSTVRSIEERLDEYQPISTIKKYKNAVYTPDGNLLLLRHDGFVYLMDKENRQERPLFSPYVKPELIHNLYMDKLQNIWIATSGNGCAKYSVQQGRYKFIESFLNTKTIYAVHIDNENNTWISTAGDGVYMLPADYKNTYSYSISDGLSELQIYSLARDKSGNIWLGHGHSNINVITTDGILKFKTGGEDNYFNRVTSFYVDEGNTVWCAMDAGLMVFEKNIVSSSNQIKRIFHNALKNITWNPLKNNIEATSSGGIIRIYESSATSGSYRIETDPDIDMHRTFTHEYDHNGNCWIADIEGLKLNEGINTFKLSDSADVLKSRITDIGEFRNEVIIVTTYGSGVVFLKDKKIFQQFSTSQGLAGNICRSLAISEKTIWVATNMGLSKIVFEQGRFAVKQNYNSTNGLLSDNVTGVIDDGRKVYVATDRGLSVMNNQLELATAKPPVIYITKIHTDSLSFDDLSNAEISWKNQRLSFEYIAPTFHNPSGVLYEYRLKGSSSVWTETKNNLVEFSSLNPGNYVFEVRARKSNSDWSYPAQLGFSIIPPFWNTLWFRLMSLALIFFSLIYVVRRYSVRRLKRQLQIIRQRQALDAERNRIASDMHDDLGSDLTKISIWSNIIENESEKPESVRKFNRQISATTNFLLKKMDEIIWALDPENDTLANLASYIHQYALTFFENSSITCFVAESDHPDIIVPSSMRRNIFLSVKESLTNILKHSDAATVGINIQAASELIEITVVDNGKGFELNNGSSDRHGMINLRKRMAEAGGEAIIKSEPGKGTILRLKIPFPG